MESTTRMNMLPLLDRKIQFDERSRAYNVVDILPTTKLRSFTWACDTHLNQGDIGACVGFSWTGELIANPVPIKGLSDRTALALYAAAQKLDDDPSNDNGQDTGTSVLAGAKAVKALGYMPEYRWAFNLEDALQAISYHGPGVAGVNWHEDMFKPDAYGIVHPTGAVAGGHAILVNGVNTRLRLVRLHNSWGPDWGDHGDCFMRFEDFGLLLKDQGEFCVPVQRRLPLHG
jgi:hypothetical protein